jgi:hypothetical protein
MPLANKELNDTILRPRFNFRFKQSNTSALSAFENSKKTQSNFIVNKVDNHVFIRVPKSEQKLSSPQLHLEIIPIDDSNCTIKGLFGPNPTIWTLFMFLHFIIVMLFLGTSIWMYSSWSLEKPIVIQCVIYTILLLTWITLYLIGQANKKKNTPKMIEQHHFMRDVLRQII